MVLTCSVEKAAEQLLHGGSPPLPRQGRPRQRGRRSQRAAPLLLRGRGPDGGGHGGRPPGPPPDGQRVPGGRPAASGHYVRARPGPRLPVHLQLRGHEDQHARVVWS